MKAHDLAALLLKAPNEEIALSVYRHNYTSEGHRNSHGRLTVTSARTGFALRPLVVISAGKYDVHEGNYDRIDAVIGRDE